MAKRTPKHEPEVTDLSRYRKAKAGQVKRKPPLATAPKASSRQPLLGSNPRAGLIVTIVAIVLLALWLGPRFL